MSGRRLRLSPSASLTTTSLGVILRSDLGSFHLQGRDLPAFLTELVPLLDGSRDEESVVQALPTYSRRSVLQLIQSLEHHGLVEAGPERETDAKERRWYLQELFFKKWIEGPKDAIRRLHQGRVLLAGLEPWGVTAANDLAHAGLGRLHRLDGAPGAEAGGVDWDIPPSLARFRLCVPNDWIRAVPPPPISAPDAAPALQSQIVQKTLVPSSVFVSR